MQVPRHADAPAGPGPSRPGRALPAPSPRPPCPPRSRSRPDAPVAAQTPPAACGTDSPPGARPEPPGASHDDHLDATAPRAPPPRPPASTWTVRVPPAVGHRHRRALVGAKIIFRSDRQSPRHTGNTVLNLGVGAAVIVFFLGSATIWTTMGGVRDVVLRGGSSSSGSNGAC